MLASGSNSSAARTEFGTRFSGPVALPQSLSFRPVVNVNSLSYYRIDVGFGADRHETGRRQVEQHELQSLLFGASRMHRALGGHDPSLPVRADEARIRIVGRHTQDQVTAGTDGRPAIGCFSARAANGTVLASWRPSRSSVAISGSADEGGERVLLQTCAAAAGAGGCVLAADSPEPEARARVEVSFASGCTRVRVTATGHRTEGASEPRVAERESWFQSDDPLVERYRAAGLIAASLGAEVSPLEFDRALELGSGHPSMIPPSGTLLGARVNRLGPISDPGVPPRPCPPERSLISTASDPASDSRLALPFPFRCRRSS